MSDSRDRTMQVLQQLTERSVKARQHSVGKKLETWFKYHAPTPDDVKKYDKINAAAKEFAKVVFEECVDGKDQDMALSLIRNARMLANSSIACKGV